MPSQLEGASNQTECVQPNTAQSRNGSGFKGPPNADMEERSCPKDGRDDQAMVTLLIRLRFHFVIGAALTALTYYLRITTPEVTKNLRGAAFFRGEVSAVWAHPTSAVVSSAGFRGSRGDFKTAHWVSK